MIRYAKGPAPRCLTTLTATPNTSWSSVHGDQRTEIRQCLLRDQASICAYCQRRIGDSPSMKIEHWEARNPGQTQVQGGPHFKWSNLLGVCDGIGPLAPSVHHGAPPRRELHCDTSRGNAALFLHPVIGHHHDPRTHLIYKGDGRVDAADADESAIATLNLNAHHLCRGRKAALDALTIRLKRLGWGPGTLSAELKAIAIKPGTTAPEHAEFLRYHLERWLKRPSSAA